MPKENTHIYFAHKLIDKLKGKEIIEIIKGNSRPYYFGSVSPDTCYYSLDRQIIAIAEHLHGKEGNPTNRIIFELLDAARARRSLVDLAFTFGFITHCALDIVFHPVIYYLSGNYYDSDPAKAEDAVYLHRHLETYLDAKVNKEYSFAKQIGWKLVKSIYFDDLIAVKFDIPLKRIKQVFRNKARILGLLRVKPVFQLLYLLNGLGIVKHKFLLGIFYGNLKRDKRIIPAKIHYHDIITGETLYTTIDELFDNSTTKASEMIAAAYDYYVGRISRAEAETVIRGESLNTGKVNSPVSLIKYYDAKSHY